ncbi:hypothetical protein JOF55_003783 [Haloactinomyces albus]|uniref:Uncharacterized protein n=1 Tax=Haloactinomyces albus TaxID=1352928 RepID=A0AAE3ZEU3_9ACTN|nr:hypothetical protein [Haloactinomyces albus]
MHGADLGEQIGLGLLRRARCTGLDSSPVVVGRGRHPGGSAGGRYREAVGLLGVDEAVAGHSVDSLTQKAHELV